jgi:hypothetical protein
MPVTMRRPHHDKCQDTSDQKVSPGVNDDTTDFGRGAPAHDHRTVLVTSARRLFTATGLRPVPCRFRYSVEDPYAVSIDIMPATGVTVTWVVARDLLHTGIRRPSGEGDFRVWPSCRQHSTHPYLYFSLDVPEGHVTFEVDLAEIRRWLDTTYRSVPSGSESELLDWNALEAALLGQD